VERVRVVDRPLLDRVGVGRVRVDADEDGGLVERRELLQEDAEAFVKEASSSAIGS